MRSNIGAPCSLRNKCLMSAMDALRAMGSAVLLSSPCAIGTASSWEITPLTGSGGNETWTRWFAPYLELIGRPAVKAFCYIDWFDPPQAVIMLLVSLPTMITVVALYGGAPSRRPGFQARRARQRGAHPADRVRVS